MDEPAPGHQLFGLLAEFDRPERLVASAARARDAGFTQVDAYSPFPVDGLTEALGIADMRVPWLTLAGGVAGAAAGYGLQVYGNLAYPIDIGGRPLLAPPPFLLTAFELMILGAVLCAVGAMLVLNHLPRLNHPVFDVPGFDRASRDRFFLVVFSADAKFDCAQTRGFLEGLDPVRIAEVGHTEEPE